MDDTTSRQQIDELADLYLTNPVQGPTPIKLAPKVASLADASSDDVLDDVLEQAADLLDDSHPMLRLTEDEEQGDGPTLATAPTKNTESIREQPINEPAPRAVLEAVLMGNLPGMSGPWLTQYAQLLAQSEGPVILLHIGESAIDLELVEPRAEAQPAPTNPGATVRIPPMRGDRTGLVGLIDALVRSESTPARTILVRFDATSDAQTLSRLSAMDDWTLLCGSDDASIAAASRQLRQAVQTNPRLADRNVGIMIMGSDDDAAQSAVQRIANNLEYDLANPVELIGHLRRMQPVQVRDLGSFPDTVALWPKLVSFFDSLEMPDPLPMPAPLPTPEAPKTQSAPPPKPVASPSPAAASRPEPMPRFRQARPTPAPPRQAASMAAAPTPRFEPATAAVTEPRNPPRPGPPAPTKPPQAASPMRSAPTPRVLSPQPELDLVALLAQGPAALEQPITLDARIPDQPQTQLAVDAAGTVHLLKKGSGVVSDDCLQLIEAGQWVRDHLELIALTQRDRGFVDTAPVLHLLTDRADKATQIAGKLAGQIKLHLLQQVTLGKETGWFCTPLG